LNERRFVDAVLWAKEHTYTRYTAIRLQSQPPAVMGNGSRALWHNQTKCCRG